MSHVSRALQGDVSLTIKTNYQVTSRGNGCGGVTRQPNFTTDSLHLQRTVTALLSAIYKLIH